MNLDPNNSGNWTFHELMLFVNGAARDRLGVLQVKESAVSLTTIAGSSLMALNTGDVISLRFRSSVVPQGLSDGWVTTRLDIVRID